jgi:MFS family permease
VVFGWTAAFLNSYVNGQVVPSNGDASRVGLYTAWVSVVAAFGSLVVGRSGVTSRLSKISILMLGSLCFAGVAIPFLMAPNSSQWTWPLLGLVYTLHGLGRCTFEGTLKAVFADYFGRVDKEGAFANIVLQNGLASSIGYVLSFALTCDAPTRYCVLYRDGTLHDVVTFELLIVAAAILAVAGLSRASSLFRAELEAEGARSRGEPQTRPLVSDRRAHP